MEALAQLVSWLPDEVLAAHLAERGGSIARLVPGLAQRLGSGLPGFGEGDAQRFVLFACVADRLQRAAEGAAVQVVLDDLHRGSGARGVSDRKVLRRIATPS